MDGNESILANWESIHDKGIRAYAAFLKNDYVELEPVNNKNVDILIKWTLDDVAQGPYKTIPNMTADQLKELFINNTDRFYFLIRDINKKPIGRFYFREWHFNKDVQKIDWELNIFIANPLERGKGYGTAVQLLALEYLRRFEETSTIFAYTMLENLAERRALEKIGFVCKGVLPDEYFRVNLEDIQPEKFCLYGYENSK